MIERDLTKKLKKVAREFPVVTLTGPRQSGKSTLCKMTFPKHAYINLEAPDIRQFALRDPRGFLAEYKNGAVLDEIQRCPEIPSYLQVLVDEDKTKGKWILTGSQNLTLLESISQSLAGRTAILHLFPLTHNEILRFSEPPETLDSLLLTGGFPRIYDEQLSPAEWLSSYVGTYLERDVRSVLKVADLVSFHRFIELCAGRTGQLLNLTSLASDAGITQPTAKAWLGVLETCFLLFRLPPFFSNFRKRLIKMPKLYFYDTGLACWLLGIRDEKQLKTHPLRGAIFETWVISEIIKHRTNQGLTGGVHFYRDRQGYEIDLLIEMTEGITALEVKAGQTVTPDALEKSLQHSRSAEVIRPRRKVVVYGGTEDRQIRDVRILPWNNLIKEGWQ